MAENKKRRVVKKSDTVRQKIEKSAEPKKERRIHKSLATSKGRLGRVAELARREYHPVKLPDNRVGRTLTKKRRVFPRFFAEAWSELRQVTWPNRRETAKLTVAVVVFAFLFGGLVALVDFGIEKIFRNLILN